MHCNVNPHLDNSLRHAYSMDYKNKAKLLLARGVIRHRMARNWNQTQLAAKAGISQSTVSRTEDGSGTAADIDTIGRLADAFGVSPWQLLSEDDARAISKADAELLATVKKLARN